MGKLEQYRQIIKTLLQQYGSHKLRYGEIEQQCIFDETHDHYLLFLTGWNKDERIHGCSIHLDIKDGKIWLQENRTEIDVAQELIDAGVVKEDIVLGLHPPYLRSLTNFAVA